MNRSALASRWWGGRKVVLAAAAPYRPALSSPSSSHFCGSSLAFRISQRSMHSAAAGGGGWSSGNSSSSTQSAAPEEITIETITIETVSVESSSSSSSSSHNSDASHNDGNYSHHGGNSHSAREANHSSSASSSYVHRSGGGGGSGDLSGSFFEGFQDVARLDTFARGRVSNYMRRMGETGKSIFTTVCVQMEQEGEEEYDSDSGSGGGGVSSSTSSSSSISSSSSSSPPDHHHQQHHRRHRQASQGRQQQQQQQQYNYYHSTVRLRLPEPHRSHVAEGIADSAKDAELLAAMHAEAVCDALGVPLFQLASSQRKHAEQARRVWGRYAPLPGDPVKPEGTPVPPPLRMLTLPRRHGSGGKNGNNSNNNSTRGGGEFGASTTAPVFSGRNAPAVASSTSAAGGAAGGSFPSSSSPSSASSLFGVRVISEAELVTPVSSTLHPTTTTTNTTASTTPEVTSSTTSGEMAEPGDSKEQKQQSDAEINNSNTRAELGQGAEAAAEEEEGAPHHFLPSDDRIRAFRSQIVFPWAPSHYPGAGGSSGIGGGDGSSLLAVTADDDVGSDGGGDGVLDDSDRFIVGVGGNTGGNASPFYSDGEWMDGAGVLSPALLLPSLPPTTPVGMPAGFVPFDPTEGGAWEMVTTLSTRCAPGPAAEALVLPCIYDGEGALQRLTDHALQHGRRLVPDCVHYTHAAAPGQAARMHLAELKLPGLAAAAAAESENGTHNNKNNNSSDSSEHTRTRADTRVAALTGRGKAPTREVALRLAAMHAELLLDALGVPLFPADLQRQSRHAAQARGYGRWAPDPLRGDTQPPGGPHAPLPLPLKQHMGGDDVWLNTGVHRAALTAGAAAAASGSLGGGGGAGASADGASLAADPGSHYTPSQGERLVRLQHIVNSLSGDMIEVNPPRRLLADARRRLRRWQVRVAGNPQYDLYIITRMGDFYRATTLLPLPGRFGTRGGNAVGRSPQQAMDLCALHALDILCMLAAEDRGGTANRGASRDDRGARGSGGDEDDETPPEKEEEEGNGGGRKDVVTRNSGNENDVGGGVPLAADAVEERRLLAARWRTGRITPRAVRGMVRPRGLRRFYCPSVLPRGRFLELWGRQLRAGYERRAARLTGPTAAAAAAATRSTGDGNEMSSSNTCSSSNNNEDDYTRTVGGGSDDAVPEGEERPPQSERWWRPPPRLFLPHLPGYIIEGAAERPLPLARDTLRVLQLLIPEDFVVCGDVVGPAPTENPHINNKNNNKNSNPSGGDHTTSSNSNSSNSSVSAETRLQSIGNEAKLCVCNYIRAQHELMRTAEKFGIPLPRAIRHHIRAANCGDERELEAGEAAAGGSGSQTSPSHHHHQTQTNNKNNNNNNNNNAHHRPRRFPPTPLSPAVYITGYGSLVSVHNIAYLPVPRPNRKLEDAVREAQRRLRSGSTGVGPGGGAAANPSTLSRKKKKNKNKNKQQQQLQQGQEEEQEKGGGGGKGDGDSADANKAPLDTSTEVSADNNNDNNSNSRNNKSADEENNNTSNNNSNKAEEEDDSEEEGSDSDDAEHIMLAIGISLKKKDAERMCFLHAAALLFYECGVDVVAEYRDGLPRRHLSSTESFVKSIAPLLPAPAADVVGSASVSAVDTAAASESKARESTGGNSSSSDDNNSASASPNTPATPSSSSSPPHLSSADHGRSARQQQQQKQRQSPAGTAVRSLRLHAWTTDSTEPPPPFMSALMKEFLESDRSRPPPLPPKRRPGGYSGGFNPF